MVIFSQYHSCIKVNNLTREKRTYRSERRERSKEQTRLEILESAITLHSQGITSVQQLANAAGVSVATVRKYFPTMEELYMGCTSHFAQKNIPPSFEEWISIPDASERVNVCVEKIYAFFEISLGLTWLAFRLQNDSSVMKQIILQIEQYLDGAIQTLLADWHPADPAIGKFIRSILHPLYYRTLRLHGGLEPDECVRFSSNIICLHLNHEKRKDGESG